MIPEPSEADGILWVASGGGHSRQASRWAQVLGFEDKGYWAVSDSPQTRSLFDGRKAFFLNQVRSREMLSPLRFFWALMNCVPRKKIHTVISTGASVAIPTLIFFSLFTNKRTFYIESLTRVHAPSLSGKILTLVPRLQLFSPHMLPGKRWKFLDPKIGFQTVPARPIGDRNSLKIFVTTGTTGKPLERLARLLKPALQPQDRLVIQGDLTIDGPVVVKQSEWFSRIEVVQNIRWSDVVVTHAGVGSVLDCLENGKRPWLVVRSSKEGEHVDDHQRDFADWLIQENLAFELNGSNLSRSYIVKISEDGSNRSW